MSWHLISSLAGLTSLGCMIWFSLKNEIKHTYFHVADKLNPYTIDCKCLVSGRRVMSCAKCNGRLSNLSSKPRSVTTVQYAE